VCREAVANPGVDTRTIVSIGLSTQQCGTCPATSSGEVLRDMISWQDVRARDQVEQITERITPERYKAITSSPITPQLPIAKILWLRDHEPQIYRRAKKWLQVQGITLQFLGADGFFLDIPQAFYYGMWDVTNLRWSKELMDIAGLDGSCFGTVVRAGTQVGELSKAASQRTGLPAGIPLCVGAGDQACGALGLGATRPGTATITLGTAGMVTLNLKTPRVDLPEFYIINHPVVGQWALQAPTLAAASAYRWFRDVFGQTEMEAAIRDSSNAFDHLNRLAASAPVGAAGLLFLPYLNSAGAPHWNADAGGAFLGIAQNHDRAHFARAVMEGVVYEIRDNLERFDGYGLTLGSIRIGGGATRSTLWNQIQADIYGMPVELLDQGESTALGAAILGGVGAGVFNNIDEGVDAMVHVSQTLEPRAAHHDRYTDLYGAYADAIRSLAASTFSRLTTLQAAEDGS
jgi:xylulokinase